MVDMHPLDNVIWQALTTRQVELGEGKNSARRFLPEVSLLGAFAAPTTQQYDSLAALLKDGERVGLFLDDSPSAVKGWTVVSSVPLLEMVRENSNADSVVNGPPHPINRLGAGDVPEMISLTELTKPGPFGPRTHEMGEYWGIRDASGRLIAMAGERLKVPGYTEISAVCTHPDHLGRGYARALMSLLIAGIADRNETSFLHVREQNTRAIKLYESLGFRHRVTLQYAILQKI
jgi:predicted GNAT family acetyltransferase